MKLDARKIGLAAAAGALALSLGACAPKPDEQTQAVIDGINAIGEVTLDSKSAIDEARYGYNRLTDDQKKLVDNESVLEDAEAALADARVQNCIRLIDEMGEPTLEDSSALQEANDAYNALSADLKKRVTNYDVLKQATDDLNIAKVKDALVNGKGTDDCISRGDWYYAILGGSMHTLVGRDYMSWEWTFFDDGTFEERCSTLKSNGTYSIDQNFVILDTGSRQEKCGYKWEGDLLHVDFEPAVSA